MEEGNLFLAIDYCMFAGVLIVSSGIGLFFTYIGNKSPEDFFMGNRKLRKLPVAMSLLTTYVSAISLLGSTGEVYAYGMQISSKAIGGPLAIFFASYLFLPVIYPLKLTSINEYIELRFKSKRLRLAIFFASFARTLLSTGVSLYAATIALESFLNLGILTNILLVGIICTVYSSFGGIRAVIWTDVFQLTVMMIGVVTILAIGVAQNGGLIETLHTASEGGRLEMFDMRLSLFVRYTFLNSFGYGFFNQLQKFASEQACNQRYGSVKSIDEARSVLTYNVWGKVIIYILIYLGGLVAYATYEGCDPITLGLIKKKDQIMAYFVMDKMRFIPGLPGLFVATVLAGALSTISSMINSCVALIWRDIFLKFPFFKNATPTFATMTTKIISLFVGAALITLAIIASNTRSVIDVYLTINGTFNGPALGVFLIGYFLPKCNLKGVWTGFITSSALLLWVSIGSMFYKLSPKMLPLSIDECDYSNFTSANISRVQEFTSSANRSAEDINTDTSFIVSLYQISSSFYIIFGPFICIILAVIVSCITGNEKIEEISPKLITPLLRKFYWTKEELSKLEEKEIKLENFSINEEESKIRNLSPERENVINSK